MDIASKITVVDGNSEDSLHGHKHSLLEVLLEAALAQYPLIPPRDWQLQIRVSISRPKSEFNPFTFFR